MIIELPNWVDKATTAKIRDAVRPYVRQVQDGYATNREGTSVSITKTPELAAIDAELHTLFAALGAGVLSRRYKPQYGSADSGYEYHRYLPGDICHHHADGEVVNGLLRYASVTLHLNTVDEGGELVFPAQNRSIKTEEGKVVIFPPYGMFGHYTTPSPEPREVIVTWFVYNNVEVKAV
jgi:hypothetical protein